ncbi:hypothetical protein C8R45DRAFT_927386 [Mycena sanguinolenta]|nr:hypothetical protein C8R45DRAFT_927386 [Mycena sanguinolenta]
MLSQFRMPSLFITNRAASTISQCTNSCPRATATTNGVSLEGLGHPASPRSSALDKGQGQKRREQTEEGQRRSYSDSESVHRWDGGTNKNTYPSVVERAAQTRWGKGEHLHVHARESAKTTTTQTRAGDNEAQRRPDKDERFTLLLSFPPSSRFSPSPSAPIPPLLPSSPRTPWIRNTPEKLGQRHLPTMMERTMSRHPTNTHHVMDAHDLARDEHVLGGAEEVLPHAHGAGGGGKEELETEGEDEGRSGERVGVTGNDEKSMRGRRNEASASGMRKEAGYRGTRTKEGGWETKARHEVEERGECEREGEEGRERGERGQGQMTTGRALERREDGEGKESGEREDEG